ncbi:MAG: sarcosine oxidase subunit gamma family protein [Hyphomicrobiales bacterium]
MAQSDPMSKPIHDRPNRLSALAHRAPLSGDGGLMMQEAVHLGKLVLRLDESVAGTIVPDALHGVHLPTLPCCSDTSATGTLSVLWLGPDEWMIVSEAGTEHALQTELEMQLKGQHFQLSNVTDYYVCIDITGHQAREILMNLTTLDMHRRSFEAGQVKGSILGHANAFVWQLHTDTGATETFRLIVRSSMADYLWCLISRSARLFGMAEETPLSGERLVI